MCFINISLFQKKGGGKGMKTLKAAIVLGLFLSVCLVTKAMAFNELDDVPSGSNWQCHGLVALPLFKLYQSNRPNTLIDAQVLSSAGGGISFGTYSKSDGKTVKCDFSISPLILLSGDTSTPGAVLETSVGLTLNFLDNTVQIGGGYDLGDIGSRPSRAFGLLSFALATGSQPKQP
jgi:hypothetical protein